MIPDSIKMHRPKNTEIHEKNGHYYVYRVKAYYDRETGKSKRKSLGCIGQIYEDRGFVSNPGVNGSDEQILVKEYGATNLIVTFTKDILNTLREYFGFNGQKIYAAAVLKLLPDFSFVDLRYNYERSFISEIIPDIDFSYQSVLNMLEDFGGKSWSRARLFKEIAGPLWEKDAAVFGITLYLKGKSKTSDDMCYAPNRILYAYEKETKSLLYYRTVPNIRSFASEYSSLTGYLERKNDTLVYEAESFRESEKTDLGDKCLSYIIPTDSSKEDNTPWNGEFSYLGRSIKYKVRPSDIKGTVLYSFYDEEREREQRSQLLDYMTKREMEKLSSGFGYSSFIASELLAPEEVFADAKIRNDFRGLFYNRNVCPEINMEDESKWRITEGWSFLNYLVYVMYFRVLRALSPNKPEAKKVSSMISIGETIFKCKKEGVWQAVNLSEEKMEIFRSAGVEF